MSVAKGVWGIDIGQCALKAIRLELIDGKPTVTAFDYIEHTKILSQPDADPDALIREALDKLLSRNQIKLDEVAIGIAGQSGLARFVKLPPVEEKKIAEIVKFEAEQQIPFPLDEVVWDFQKIAGGEAVDGFALETEIGLFAMKRDVIARYLGYFNASRIEVHTVQMSPLALVNFATYDILKKGGPALTEEEAEAEKAAEAADDIPRGKKRCAVVMDIGTDASNLIITDGAKIIWQRPIPLGGSNFTRALTKELKLTFAKAEHLKRNAAKSPEMASILKAIKPVLTDFVGEVQRSLGYFTNTHRDAHVAYMVGLGSAFKLPGLQKYLSDKLSLEVRKPAEFARLSGENVLADPLFQENLLTFPVAYGLALQGLGQARLSTNLLPQEIRTDRMIRAKKPYAVAAAAMLLVGTCALAWGYGEDLKSATDPKIKVAEDKVTSAVSAFAAQQTKVDGKKKDSEDEQKAGKMVIAGNDERLNWPRFFEVETAAMPRPGEKGNLNEPNQRKYSLGAGTSGTDALAWFKKRMQKGVPVSEALEDDRSEHPKHLAMVNIESVHSRWVTNVPGFLSAADLAVYGDGKDSGFHENIADYMLDNEKVKDETQQRFKPDWKPTLAPGEDLKGAWIVEIRGYTDFEEGRQFLKACLIRNIQKFDTFAKDENKVGKYIVGVADPVKGRVSHAFIYHVWQVDDAQPNTLVNIKDSYLDGIIPNAGASDVGGEGGLPPTPTGTGAAATAAPAGGALGPAWTGLTGSGGAARPVAGGRPGGFAPPQTFQTQPGVEKKDNNSAPRRRWEFVVMLVWREPIPSGSGTPAPIAAAPVAAPATPAPAAAPAAGAAPAAKGPRDLE